MAAAVPWSGRGAGATIALHRVGDLILSGALDAWVPRGAGLAVYAVPLGGALLLVGAGWGGRRGAALSAVAVVLAAAGTALVVAALDRLGRSGSGPGLVLAVAGTVLGAAAAVARRGRRPGAAGSPTRGPGPGGVTPSPIRLLPPAVGGARWYLPGRRSSSSTPSRRLSREGPR